MKVVSLFMSLVCAVSCLQAVQEWQFQDKKGRVISRALYRPHEMDIQLVQQLRDVFVQSFSVAYKDIPLTVLGINNLSEFLNAAFDDEEADIKQGNQRDHFIVVARYNGALIGFSSFNALDAHCYYIRQLSINPAFQGAGIGEQLVMSVKKYDSQTHMLKLITRRANMQARNFYVKKLGFTESVYMHEGYNPEKYVGYEKVLN